MLRETVFVFAAFVALTGATTVNQCGTETPFEDTSLVKISGCDKPECLLKQGTNAVIEIKLKPDRDIQSLTNDVNAVLFNVPLPFIGVDGTNACDNIYNADGSKSGCPLEKGTEYIYRNSFPVLSLYPRVSLVVRYALREGNDKITCFEVAAKITK